MSSRKANLKTWYSRKIVSDKQQSQATLKNYHHCCNELTMHVSYILRAMHSLTLPLSTWLLADAARNTSAGLWTVESRVALNSINGFKISFKCLSCSQACTRNDENRTSNRLAWLSVMNIQ